MTTTPRGAPRPGAPRHPPRRLRRPPRPGGRRGDGHLRRPGPPRRGRRRVVRRAPAARAARARQRRRLGRGVPRRARRRPGRPGLLAPPRWSTAWDPDVVAAPRAASRTRSAHELHPDLALLLSTSGSTGSPKLVRLARDGRAGQRRRDRRRRSAIRADRRRRDHPAAALLLRPLGAAQPPARAAPACCSPTSPSSTSASGTWSATHGVTTVPGVPHTFELLERGGFAERDVPSLRTSPRPAAGWRPSGCARFAELGQRRGFDLFVMYGATEATARMSVLPPDLAAGGARVDRPAAAGHVLRPRRRSTDRGDGVGELVFTGPNVMLGLRHDAGRPRRRAAPSTSCAPATSPASAPTGCGRSSAGATGSPRSAGCARPRPRRAGARATAGSSWPPPTAGTGSSSAVVDGAAARRRRRRAPRGRRAAGLRPRRCRGRRAGRPAAAGQRQGRLPRAARRSRPRRPRAGASPATAGGRHRRRRHRAAGRGCWAARTRTPDDSFVDLGGDSLSYVEASLRLERAARPPARGLAH